MSMTKDAWMDAVANVGDDFQARTIDFDEAVKQLKRLGLSREEAETLLREQYL